MYSIVEERRYSHECREFAKTQAMDEALAGVMDYLQHHPEQFPIVSVKHNWRMVKTMPFTRGDIYVPKLRIWFTIEEEAGEKRVRLLSIQADPDE